MKQKLVVCGAVLVALVGGTLSVRAARQAPVPAATSQAPILTQAEWDRLFKQVSNWGRWGKDDQKGTLNLLTPEKRKQAAALVKTGIAVTLEHPLIEEKAPDVANPFRKSNKGTTLHWESTHGGAYHSHIDALCHMDYKGQVYNGFIRKEIETEDACVKMGIDNYKDGIFTRGVLIDMPRFKGLPWLEPGTPVTRQDLEAWEKKTGIKVLPGDAVLLRTGKWGRRAKLGPWVVGGQGPDAGYHWTALAWLKEKDVAVIGDDGPNDVRPAFVEAALGSLLPVHIASIAAMGAVIVDGQDLEALADTAAKLNRWEFLLTGAPLNITGGGGSPLNLTAVF